MARAICGMLIEYRTTYTTGREVFLMVRIVGRIKYFALAGEDPTLSFQSCRGFVTHGSMRLRIPFVMLSLSWLVCGITIVHYMYHTSTDVL